MLCLLSPAFACIVATIVRRHSSCFLSFFFFSSSSYSTRCSFARFFLRCCSPTLARLNYRIAPKKFPSLATVFQPHPSTPIYLSIPSQHLPPPASSSSLSSPLLLFLLISLLLVLPWYPQTCQTRAPARSGKKEALVPAVATRLRTINVGIDPVDRRPYTANTEAHSPRLLLSADYFLSFWLSVCLRSRPVLSCLVFHPGHSNR